MADWSQSHFLKSIGWATLNSIWQIALLWVIFLGINALIKMNSRRRYQLALGLMTAGFFWTIISFTKYYLSPVAPSATIFPSAIEGKISVFPALLTAASVTYLLLLVIPAYRLFRNWRFVQQIKIKGLHKVEIHHRLFIQKISSQLGIARQVGVYISELITSPLTIGYLKPVILLPVAAMNNLSTHQVEAILLHELSHIRRNDYLVNLLVNIISTILYFNPFLKNFLRVIEEEREKCCDELVLQFGYDTGDYASALFTLEKLSTSNQPLAIAATGKNSLLKRIEKMAGMEEKNSFGFRQLATIVAAFAFVIACNSMLILKERKKSGEGSDQYQAMINPLLFSPGGEMEPEKIRMTAPETPDTYKSMASAFRGMHPSTEIVQPPVAESEIYALPEQYQFVSADAVDASLTTQQKEQVSSTVKATKKIIKNMQWKDVENQIGEVMTPEEKAFAKAELENEMESINWENVEKNLKAQYENIDWNKINNRVSSALTVMELEKMQSSYSKLLAQLEKAEAELLNKSNVTATPLPDGSVSELKKLKEDIKTRIQIIQGLKENKVIRL